MRNVSHLKLSKEEQGEEFDRLMNSELYREVRAVNVTTYDRGVLQGRQEGRLKGKLEAILELRFGELGVSLLEQVQAIEDIRVLEHLVHVLQQSKDLEEFRVALNMQPTI